MFDKEFIERLIRYIGKSIKITVDNNVVDICYDIQTRYILKKEQQQYKLYVHERNLKSEIRVFNTEKDMKRFFALCMKNVFSSNIEYLLTDKIESAGNIIKLDSMLSKCVEKDLYSINIPLKNRINLDISTKKLYNIYFLDKEGIKYFLEQDGQAPYIFGRFYNEIIYYKEMLARIEEYEDVFKDKLSYEEKLQLLGYKIFGI